MSHAIISPVGVLHFPSLFTSRSIGAGPAQRRGTLAFDEGAQSTPGYEALLDALALVERDQFGGDHVRWPLRKDPFGGKDVRVTASACYDGLIPVVDDRLRPMTDPNSVWSGQLASFSMGICAYSTKDIRGDLFRGLRLELYGVIIVRRDMPNLAYASVRPKPSHS